MATTFADGDDVKIDDTSTTTTISGSGVAPHTTEINVTRNLTLSGDVFSSNSGTLTKNGTGTLITKASAWSKEKGNLLTNLVINSGTVEAGVRAAYNSFVNVGDSRSRITINNGGKLWCKYHSDMGVATQYPGEHTIVVNPGGTLDLYTLPNTQSGSTTAKGCHTIGSLLLNGGTLKYGRSWEGSGFTEIHHLLSFDGTTPYDLEYDRSDYRARCADDKNDCAQIISFYDTSANANKMVELRVADITGDAAVDVKFGIPITRPTKTTHSPAQSVAPHGVRKTGLGTVQFATNFVGVSGMTSLDGEWRIESGVVDLAYAKTLDMLPERTVYIGTNVELKVTAKNALTFSDTSIYKLQVGYTTLHVDHGKLTLANPGSASASSGNIWEACNYVGGLILDHATFDFSAIKNGANSYGFMALGKILKVITDEPYVLEPAKTLTSNPGIGLRAYSDAYRLGVPEVTDAQRNFYTNAAMQGTEIYIDKIPGNTLAYDLLINAPFVNERSYDSNLHGGFIKTGSGTLALVNTASSFGGDVTVREGTLLLATNAYSASASSDSTILGRYSYEKWGPTSYGGRTITVENGSTLAFGARNFFLSEYTKATGSTINVSFKVKSGGKLKFVAPGTFNLLHNLTIEDGSIEISKGAFHYGCIKPVGPMKVRGSTPLTIAYTDTEPATDAATPAIMMSYSPRTEFDVADVTGDAAADMTLDIPVVINNSTDYTTSPIAFKKTGVGTLRYSAPQYSALPAVNLAGDCDVAEGTLVADGDAFFRVTVKVSEGAYLGGTGTVNNVELAAGAGLRIPARQTKPLAITGNFTLGENPVIDFCSSGSSGEVRANVLTVSGTITGAENLTNAVVKIDGETTSDVKVRFVGNKLKASTPHGLALQVK